MPERPEVGPPRGVLRKQPESAGVEHRRVAPAEELAPTIAHYWWVRWSLAAPLVAETLPHPSMHVIFEDNGRAEVSGVPSKRFERRLEGRGWVFGIKLRPATSIAWTGAPASASRDTVRPVDEVLGALGRKLARAVFAADGLDAKVAAVEHVLAPRAPALSTEVIALRDLVERMERDRELVRVEDVARLAGVTPRELQRRFRELVGVSPKWVIKRYRLHEAAERLKAEPPPSLAALAAELGYSDQAHFARDFAATIGRTPAQFAKAEGG